MDSTTPAECRGGEPQDPPQPTVQDTLDKILGAIEDTKSTLQRDINQVAVEVGLLRAVHHRLVDRVKEIENTLAEIAPQQKDLKAEVTYLADRVARLEQRAEDAEGRSRRNNVRVVGLPEGAEGANMMKFLEEWLRTVVAPGCLTPFYTLERAHRVPSRPLAPGRPPHVVIARLLHYRDRDILLQRAREVGPFKVANGEVTLFPDFTLDVQTKRASFLAVKRALRDEGIQYSLLFPAKLKVPIDGKTTFFQTSEGAWEWLEARGAQVGRHASGSPSGGEARRGSGKRRNGGRLRLAPTKS
ncbi:hypothetical protein NDU88_001046 [Pleurodeles waltl]|uniref:L1 transposable element RRM domain-containing protein n=1 Tax=Pleurodeles waltl TaxID=8319 RepID=A0AAV7UU80_PLEWA|nr:hypothetical protein NDU88_001046 [Pleurodeles waltl]